MEDRQIDLGGQKQEGPIESDILPQAEMRRKPVFNPMGRVEHIMADEVKVADVRRHPIGLFILYLQVLVGFGIAFLIILLLLPGFMSTLGADKATSAALISVLVLSAAVFAFIFLILATKIYTGNQLIITDSNVTQILQKGLFNRIVSELSMHNVEDVTALQKGILQTLFNYGTLTIETAGEQNNFIFVYCPNPNAYAKAVLDSRQMYFQRHSGIDT